MITKKIILIFTILMTLLLGSYNVFALSACGSLISAGTTYTMTQNITSSGSPCLTIGANQVTLDCDGYTISGNNNDIAIVSSGGYDNTTIKDCNIINSGDSGVEAGILLINTDEVTVQDSTFDNCFYGIRDQSGNNNLVVTGNSFYGNTFQDIYFSSVSICSIYNNIFNGSITQGSCTVWNTTKTCGAEQNILGGDCLGGNFYWNYTGTDYNGDGIGDATFTIGTATDYLPLITGFTGYDKIQLWRNGSSQENVSSVDVNGLFEVTDFKLTNFFKIKQISRPFILVFNYLKQNTDFVIKGITDDDLFFVDASEGKVGIKTDSPNETLSVVGNLSVSTNATIGTDLTIGNCIIFASGGLICSGS